MDDPKTECSRSDSPDGSKSQLMLDLVQHGAAPRTRGRSLTFAMALFWSAAAAMSDFWVRKMKTYFQRIDFDKDGSITQKDFEGMAERFVTREKLDEARGKELKNKLLQASLAFIDASRIVCGAYVTAGGPSVCPSVCLSHRFTAAAAAGGFAAEVGRGQQISMDSCC